jgi:hypothetical protein
MITHKTCTKCKIKKSLSSFHKNKAYKDGYRYECKSCRKNEVIKYGEWSKRHPEKAKQSREKYKKNNKEKLKTAAKAYYEKNKEKIHKINDEYYKKNKNRLNNIKLKNSKIKRRDDINYKIKCNIRGRIRHALKNNLKKGSSLELLGCSIKKLKNHLGIRTWYNSNKYHIDHIIPCSIYNFEQEIEQKKCFNWRNLRLIKKEENISKHNKIDLDLIKFYKIEDLLPNKFKEYFYVA